MDKFKSIKLICGSCGTDFKTWPGYVDQDQDKGYGICRNCQEVIRYHAWWDMTTTIQLLLDNLNPINRFKYLYMPREEQEMIAWNAIECGMITYHIDR